MGLHNRLKEQSKLKTEVCVSRRESLFLTCSEAIVLLLAEVEMSYARLLWGNATAAVEQGSKMHLMRQ